MIAFLVSGISMDYHQLLMAEKKNEWMIKNEWFWKNYEMKWNKMKWLKWKWNVMKGSLLEVYCEQRARTLSHKINLPRAIVTGSVVGTLVVGSWK